MATALVQVWMPNQNKVYYTNKTHKICDPPQARAHNPRFSSLWERAETLGPHIILVHEEGQHILLWQEASKHQPQRQGEWKTRTSRGRPSGAILVVIVL